MGTLRARLTVIAASATLAAAGLLTTATTATATTPPVCVGHSLAVSHTPFNGAAGHLTRSSC